MCRAVAGSACRWGARRGACPAGRRLTVPFRNPQGGGLPFGLPAAPDFSLLFCPPSPKGKDRPPAPFPSGEGGDSKFISPGASPPAPLRPGGKRHWFFLWKAVPEGGLSPGLPAGSAMPVPEGGLACFVACRPCSLFEFLPPSPLPPSRREGGVSKFILPGASPPAPLQSGGKRHWLFLWKAVPQGGLRPLHPRAGIANAARVQAGFKTHSRSG